VNEAVMILVYGDESLDQTQDRVCAVAGVVGTVEQWDWIESIWVKRTGGTPFHANDCDSDHGDYAPKEGEDADNKHKENKALYKDLTILLAESGLGGFASVNDLAAQRKAFPPPYDPPLYYQGFMDVLEAMRNAADNLSDMATITFDSRMESQFNAAEIYAYLQECGLAWSEHLASKIEFESSRKNPRIQVADLFAREAMKNADNDLSSVKRVRRSWEALKATRRFRIEKFDEAYFSELSKNTGLLDEILGITAGDYEKWLEEKRVPRCHTSYFKFLFWKRGQMSQEQETRFFETFGESYRLR
jgi:hypothetical protein